MMTLIKLMETGNDQINLDDHHFHPNYSPPKYCQASPDAIFSKSDFI